ncbi:MAG: hypothetical protein RIT81_25200 [Deltaproteobacteria bacterium]
MVLQRPSSFSVEQSDAALRVGAVENPRWMIDAVEIMKGEDGIELKLSGSHPVSPRVRVVCADVTVREIALVDLDGACPGWSRPGARLFVGDLDA